MTPVDVSARSERSTDQRRLARRTRGTRDSDSGARRNPPVNWWICARRRYLHHTSNARYDHTSHVSTDSRAQAGTGGQPSALCPRRRGWPPGRSTRNHQPPRRRPRIPRGRRLRTPNPAGPSFPDPAALVNGVGCLPRSNSAIARGPDGFLRPVRSSPRRRPDLALQDLRRATMITRTGMQVREGAIHASAVLLHRSPQRADATGDLG
jgi:hypothetical protein